MPRSRLNMGDTNDLISILKEELIRVTCGCEVGVHRGDTSMKLLWTFPELYLYMVDPWSVYSPTHPYFKSGDQCARQSLLQQEGHMATATAGTHFAAHRREILRRTSVDAGDNWRGPRLDFVFIDDDHTLAGVRASLVAWWHTVKEDGLMAGHDWNHPRCKRGIWGVNQAVTEFCEQNQLQLNVRGETWWCRKPMM